MPLYEYNCTACHKRTEKIQKFSDPEITVCPKCGGHLERVLSAPAIAFKGGGWYADGYGNAKPASAASGEGTSGEAKPSSDAGSSETKTSPEKSTPASAATAAAPAASPAPAAKD